MKAALVVVCAAGFAAAQQRQFMEFTPRPPQSYLPTINQIVGGIAVGDVDSDGRRDFVLNEAPTGRMLLAAPGGGFTSLTLPAGGGGQRPLLADLDGDGDLDVVTAPLGSVQQTQVVAFRKNPADLTVLPLPLTIPMQGVALGDVDGDGDVDMVVATISGFQSPLLLWLNTGAGAFTAAPAAMPPGLPSSWWPCLVDVDRDGDLDLLAGTPTGGFVLLRNIGGAFVDARGSLPTTRIGHTFLCTGDLDGDGFVDAAATWANGDLDVLWGSAAGFTFQPAVLPAVGVQVAVRTLLSADIDGDGDLDLIAERSTGLDRLRNVGGRQFVREPAIGVALSALGVDDVDGDGAADLLFTLASNTTLLRYWHHCEQGAEEAGFVTGFRGPPGLRSEMPLAADVDGDGRTDVLVPSTGGLGVDRAFGDGRYALTVTAPPVLNPSVLERSLLRDLDGDGDPDLVVVTDSGLGVFANNGSGAFTPQYSFASSGVGRDDVRVGDVDGDGRPDFALARPGLVYLIHNLGNGAFSSQLLASGGGGPFGAVELADLDGDGDLDIVTGIAIPGGHRVLANNGTGQFSAAASMAVDLGPSPASVRAADVDGDGDLDLFSDVAGLLLNNGTGTFTLVSASHLPPTTGSAQANLVCADLDDDGDVDLFVSRTSTGPLLYLNDGTGTFLNATNARWGLNSIGLTRADAVDVDDDGDLDLLLFATVGFEVQHIFANHLRQLHSLTVPRIGRTAQFEVYSGPGFGSSGLAMLGIGFARAAVPVALPGLAGRLQLDPATLQIAATVPTSSVGVSTVFLPVPPVAALVGTEAWLQAAVLPSVGRAGLTNAVYEVVTF